MDRMNIFMHVLRGIRFIARRWWIFLLSLLLTGGFAGYKAFTLPDKFQSRAELAPPLTPMEENVLIIEENNVDKVVKTFYSDRIHQAINQKFADYRSPDGQYPMVEPRHETSGGGGFTFDLVVTSTDEKFAEMYVSEWAQLVIEEKLSAAENFKKNVLDEKNDTLKALETERANIIAQSQNFLRANPGFDLSGDDTFKRLQSDEQDIMDRLEDITLKLSTTTSQTYSETSGGATQEAHSLRMELDGKKKDRLRWAADLKDQHPFMQTLIKEIESLEQDLMVIENAANAGVRQKQNDLEIQKSALETRLADIRAQLVELNPKQKTYQDLLSSQKDIEASIKTKREEIARNKEGTLSLNLEIVQPGRSEGLIGPNRPMLLAMGIIAGFILAGVAVFFLSKLDDRLELAEDLERELMEHVLGQVPKVTNPPSGKSRFLITDLGLHDMFCEALRGVRSAFKYYTKGDKQIRSLVITSAVPGDGKSTVTVNFGATLAMAGNRVLLIDADLRRGSVNEFFDFKRSGGLSDVLSGRVHWLDVTRESQIPNLDVITTGKLPMNPGELLSSAVVPVMIKQAMEEYDYVIIDCPPLTAIDDAFSLFEHVDTGLFVVRAGQTSLRFIKNALHELDKRGQGILGIILNGITTADPSYYYAKYYHSYYNKDLPNASVESGSVYQPAAAMPEPRKRPSRSSTANTQSAPPAADNGNTLTATADPESAPQSDASDQPAKTVRYKARRAHRTKKNN